jgi:hypothetical protein
VDRHQANGVDARGPLGDLAQVLLFSEQLQPANGTECAAVAVTLRGGVVRPHILEETQELKNRESLLLRGDRVVVQQVTHISAALEQIACQELPGISPEPDPRKVRSKQLELRVPRVRDGSFFPGLLEPRKRAERALVATVREAYVQGVSTRRVDDLVKALGLDGISRSQVSRLCEELDTEVERFRNRKLDGSYPYVWLDATVRHEAPSHRAGGRSPPTVCRSRSPKLEAA